jgi:uncharacterized MAPEG superfamily protein
MTPELAALALAGLLQMVQTLLYAIPANRELGPAYAASPRDEAPPRPLGRRTARLKRAMDNHTEALVLFAAAVAAATLADQSDGFTAACAWVYLVARILYVPAYVFGLVPWRSLLWAAGWLATGGIFVATLI